MLNQQNSEGGNEDKGEERSIQLVIAGKHSAKPLELLKETLDQVTLPVSIPIYRPWIRNIDFRRYGIACSPSKDIVSDGFCVVSFVSRDVAAFGLNLTHGMSGIMVSATAEQKGHRIPRPSTMA